MALFNFNGSVPGVLNATKWKNVEDNYSIDLP